jgi:hypothetical protein
MSIHKSQCRFGLQAGTPGRKIPGEMRRRPDCFEGGVSARSKGGYHARRDDDLSAANAQRISVALSPQAGQAGFNAIMPGWFRPDSLSLRELTGLADGRFEQGRGGFDLPPQTADLGEPDCPALSFLGGELSLATAPHFGQERSRIYRLPAVRTMSFHMPQNLSEKRSYVKSFFCSIIGMPIDTMRNQTWDYLLI